MRLTKGAADYLSGKSNRKPRRTTIGTVKLQPTHRGSPRAAARRSAARQAVAHRKAQQRKKHRHQNALKDRHTRHVNRQRFKRQQAKARKKDGAATQSAVLQTTRIARRTTGGSPYGTRSFGNGSGIKTLRTGYTGLFHRGRRVANIRPDASLREMKAFDKKLEAVRRGDSKLDELKRTNLGTPFGRYARKGGKGPLNQLGTSSKSRRYSKPDSSVRIPKRRTSKLTRA